MSSTLPPDFDVSRLRGVPDPLGAERAPALEVPPLPDGAPTRAARIARQKIVLALGVGWMMGQLAVLGAREDLTELPLSYLAALVVAPLIGSGLALALAMSPGKFGLGARPALLTAAAIAFPVSLLVAGLLLSPTHESGPKGTFWQGVGCFGLMVGWAALPMAFAAVVLQRWFVVRAPVRSALVGIAAGMAAAAVINLHCHVTGVWHVAIGHWFAIAVAALSGVWVLARRTRL